MHATITLEFTDEDLVKHAEDVGRRITRNFIRQVIPHVGAVDPSVWAVLANALASVAKTEPPGAAERTPPPHYPPVDVSQETPKPGAPSSPEP